MSETKHTPGPWRHVENGTGPGGTGTIAFNGSCGFDATPWGNPEPLDRNDLRLIAAAPDLLAALKEIVQDMSAGGAVTPLNLTGTRRVHDAATAAIAKAEGKG